MNETKTVTWRSLHPGDKLTGWHQNNTHNYGYATVKCANIVSVTISLWDKEEIQLDSETSTFDVELTRKEFEKKYRSYASSLVNALTTVVIDEQEAGYHEMWNGWIDPDPYIMASECKKNNMHVVGLVRLLFPKTSFFGEVLDVGICCEYDNGQRFWCHTFSGLTDRIIDKFSYLLENGKETKEQNNDNLGQ